MFASSPVAWNAAPSRQPVPQTMRAPTPDVPRLEAAEQLVPDAALVRELGADVQLVAAVEVVRRTSRSTKAVLKMSGV